MFCWVSRGPQLVAGQPRHCLIISRTKVPAAAPYRIKSLLGGSWDLVTRVITHVAILMFTCNRNDHIYILGPMIPQVGASRRPYYLYRA